MRTDIEKHELREIQQDTTKAIFKFLQDNLRNLTAEQTIGYMQCLNNLEWSEVHEIDEFRSYKTTRSPTYELGKPR